MNATYTYTASYYTDVSYWSRVVRNNLSPLFASLDGKLEHVHSDDRRSIHEYNGSDFSVQKFEVYSGNVPLGNHFHKKSVGQKSLEDANFPGISEMFVFDEGSGVLLLQNISPDGEALGMVKEFNVTVNSIIAIPPFQAHTFFLESGTKFRGFRPYPFDEQDTDLNPHKLEISMR